MKQTELYLNREGVDAASQEIAVWLAELGMPSRDVLRRPADAWNGSTRQSRF